MTKNEEYNWEWVTEFQKYFLASITCIGFLTNLLSLVLMLRQKFRKTTVGIYIATISCFDNLSLIVTFLFILETELYKQSYITSSYSDVLCKILNVGAYVFITTSVYLIAVLSCERCYVTLYPYRPKPKRKHALICVSIVIVLISACYSPIAAVMYGLSPVQDGQVKISHQTPDGLETSSALASVGGTPSEFTCKPLPQYQISVDNYVVVFDLIVAVIIPVIIITGANILLIVKLVKERKNLESYTQQSNIINAKKKRERQVTYMLVTASVFYLVCTLPAGMYVCFIPLSQATFNSPVWVILFDLYIMNYSLNFFVYVVSGKTFRDELKKLICCESEQPGVVQMAAPCVRISAAQQPTTQPKSVAQQPSDQPKSVAQQPSAQAGPKHNLLDQNQGNTVL